MHIFASHQCTDYVCASYAVAGEACMARVTFVGLGEAVWFKYYPSRNGTATPSSPTSISIAKGRCHPPIHLSRAYLNVSHCVTHIWPIPMVCNNIPHDIPERDLPRMYVRTYILCENRSSIQSLALMRSATI